MESRRKPHTALMRKHISAQLLGLKPLTPSHHYIVHTVLFPSYTCKKVSVTIYLNKVC